MQSLEELVKIITLEKINENTFLGKNYKAPWGRVFGGQVLAQSLHAAYQTVPEDRYAHSMHAYFILGGDVDVPIKYEVDVIRDGGSFATRRVVAFQNEKPIFNMSSSFQKKLHLFRNECRIFRASFGLLSSTSRRAVRPAGP